MIELAALIEGLCARWNARRSGVEDVRELRACEPDIVARIAGDLNMSAGELRQVAASGGSSDRLMERMMAGFHLDRDTVAALSPVTLRDAEITCSHCSARKRCAREMAAGTATANAHHFCPNADLFEQLTAH